MDIIDKIQKLKEKRKALILAHNYQSLEIQKVADFVADSLELAKFAKDSDAKIIILCGVRFMAETIKILSPEKKVILPAEEAACPLADMISPDDIDDLKQRYPEALVVCYINSTAKVKAKVDFCCTSRNASEIISALPYDKQIIFVPDKYLGRWVMEKIEKPLILWDGYCPVHMKIIEEDILELKKKYPLAEVLAHPECKEEVKKLADYVFGTGGMIMHVKKSDKKEFIIATEKNMCHTLKLKQPDKDYYPASEDAICPNMALTDLQTLLFALEELEYEIKLDIEIIEKAKLPIERMLKLT